MPNPCYTNPRVNAGLSGFAYSHPVLLLLPCKNPVLVTVCIEVSDFSYLQHACMPTEHNRIDKSLLRLELTQQKSQINDDFKTV